jgi:hypothetical protein
MFISTDLLNNLSMLWSFSFSSIGEISALELNNRLKKVLSNEVADIQTCR